MAITYDQANNKIAVTGYTAGTPCNFNNLHTADIGATNGRDLLDGAIDADPDTFSLDNQPAPADSLAVPLKITCTARAGATCDIAGTDAWGNALTENGIDISSGSATTTKRFATVDASGITVNGMTNGDDFDVKQDRWGVVSKQGSEQFFITSNVEIGDGSATTWFTDTAISVQVGNSSVSCDFLVAQYATFKLYNSFMKIYQIYTGDRTTHKRTKGEFYFIGCSVVGVNSYYPFIINSPGTFYMWNSYLKANRFYNEGGGLNVLDSVFELIGIHGILTDPIIDGYTLKGSSSGLWTGYNHEITFKRAKFTDCTKQIYIGGGGTYAIFHLLDSQTPVDGTKVLLSAAAGDRYLSVEYSFNLKVTDEDNNGIDSATVKIWDANELKVDTTTGGIGVIAEQVLIKERYDYTHCPTPISYNDFIIQISKAGYETFKKKFTLDKKTDWTIKLKHSNVCVDQEVMLA